MFKADTLLSLVKLLLSGRDAPLVGLQLLPHVISYFVIIVTGNLNISPMIIIFNQFIVRVVVIVSNLLRIHGLKSRPILHPLPEVVSLLLNLLIVTEALNIWPVLF
jgi:hypothetical protein